MVVEEPVVSLVTLESVLSYLGSASDIRPRPGQDAKLTEYFGRVIEQEGECALTEFVQIFDEALVVHTNASGEFHPPPAGTAEERNRSYILAPLRNLVEGGDPLAANELVKGLERKYRTYVWTVEELLVGLQQATESMLRSPRPRSRRSSFARSEIVEDERDLSRVLWTVALISRTQEGRRLVDSDREELTPHPDLGLATFDLWIRDFVSRDGVRETDNPIPDLWAELSAALDWYAAQSVDRPNPLQKLFVALRTYLERWSSIAGRPNWISRLIYLSEEADRKRDLQSLSRPLR